MKWILGLLCLVIIILFHEFGHFIAAKIFGVKVESFSIGFGPVLFHKRIKETDFRISLFPLGGYCGMKGENDFQKAIEDDLPEIYGEKDSLYGIHPLKRAAIGFAGPFFNFIFAIFCFTIINCFSVSYKSYSNTIIVPEVSLESEQVDNPAIKAGLKTGDKILKVNNTEILDFSDIVENISKHPDDDVVLTIERDSQIIKLNVHVALNKETGAGRLGISADTSTLASRKTKSNNIFIAIGKGIKQTFSNIGLTFKTIGLLFKGINIKNAVSGPLKVTDILGSTIKDSFSDSIKLGFFNMFNLLGIISISLFIMNLLPIPVLDGGLILFAIIELIAGKKIKPKLQYYIQFIGLGLIVMLFLVIIVGDISYYIQRGTHK